jgi:hypothetical protein
MTGKAMGTMTRAGLLLGAAAIVAGCGSDGTLKVCAAAPSITAPLGTPMGAREPVLRFHGGVTRDSTWPARLTQEVAAVRADSIVQVLLVHATAVNAGDREFVTTRAGFVVGEVPASNGILARFTVETLRTFIPQVSTARVIDAHLSATGSIPACD